MDNLTSRDWSGGLGLKLENLLTLKVSDSILIGSNSWTVSSHTEACETIVEGL